MAETTADIASLSFEEALAELEQIVRRLESGAAPLDQAIDAYTRGAALKAHCEKKLAEAKARVEKIVMNGDGSVGAVPADLGG